MTNYEKCKDKLQELIDKGVNIAVDKETGEPRNCKDISCLKCAIYDIESSCKNSMIKWLLSEYEEPSIDWSKVPVDTPIYVKMAKSCDWTPRYFAKYEKGTVYTWLNGTTSFSTENKTEYTPWVYAKLAKEEDKND